MSLDDILKRRALKLKVELSEGDRPKPSFLSTIYPAMDHGANMPRVVKTPTSIPGSNDSKGEEPKDSPEKGQKEKDEPGPSKTDPDPLFLPGQSGLVPDAHKKAAFELGYFGENRSEQFVKRCVELITGVKKLEQQDQVECCAADSKEPSGEDVEAGEPTSNHSKLTELAKKFTKTKPSYG
jgi:hypothetical protein